MIIFWAGSEESFELVLKAQAKAEAMQASPEAMQAGYIEDLIAQLPPIWRHEGGQAIVEVNGPVVQGSAGWLRLFGVIGYADIAAAATEATAHKDTKSVLYHINSPGGDVAGIVDMCNTLSALSAQKPSSVHTSELMCSAGYWMASSIQGSISAGPTAIVGSIGVLRVHQEVTKRLEQNGVKVTVLRAGQFKAEGNPYEELSDEAKERAEAQLADVHALFRAQVGRGRPNLTPEKLAEVTQGQTFLGKRAVQAGLVDRIGSFELASKLLDNRKHQSDNPPKSKGKATMNLTAEQIEKINAGEMTLNEAIAENEAAAAAQAAAQAEAEAKAKADAEAAAKDKGTQESVVDLLKAQLVTAQAERDAAREDLVAYKAKHTDQSATHDGLLAIARSEIGRMSIALGGNDAAAQTMDAATAVAEHARISATFQEKFPAGRVSQPAGESEKPKASLPLAFQYAKKPTR